MKNYSGGYVAINPNIAISDIENKAKIPSIQEGIFAVLENILLRGVPTKPSAYLAQKIGTPEKTEENEEKEEKEEKGAYWYAVGDRLPCWDRVIKGWINEEGKEINPAREYYKKLQEISKTASQLFLPECPFNQIVLQSTASDLSARDFYSPFYNVNIEMDGAQHESAEQKAKDEGNDEKLEKIVKIQRIRPNRLKTLDEKKLKDWLENHLPEEIKPIDELKPFQRNYLYIFRLQLVFLQLFKYGQIPLEQGHFLFKLTIPGIDNEFFQEVFDLALEDLTQWLENLFKLADLPFEMPQIELTKASNADFKIDIDPYSFYDQTIYENDGIIRVRNDYFPYDRAANTDGKKYAISKNYYQVATAIEDGKVVFPFQNADASNPAHEAALTFLLENLFGFPEFRPKQLEIVAAGLHPENGVIGILPTGSGKSVCYQLVSMLTPAVSLIISPLKVLMDDQTNNLDQKHLISTAERIHSSSKIEGMELFKCQQLKLVYVSPERFFNPKFTETVANKPIGQVVLDEVHCLSEWGHDFRTAYLLLFPFLKEETSWGKDTLLMGTTATASYRVVSDISSEFLTIKNNREHIIVITNDSVKRPELTFKVIRCQYESDRNDTLKKILGKDGPKTLIFALTQKNRLKSKDEDRPTGTPGVEDVYSFLRIGTDGQKAIGFYHAEGAWEDIKKADTNVGKTDIEKNKDTVFEDFKEGKIKTLVATKAFGMGVDIRDIQRTVHYQIPCSVESLYQEMGRAGRNGEPSTCYILLWTYPDLEKKIKEVFEKPFSEELLLSARIGDLSTPVWFIRQNIGIDPEKICDVYERIKVKPDQNSWTADNFCDIWGLTDQDKDNKANQENFEKALYKLYILGMINLWKISYNTSANPSYLGISVKELSDEIICDNLVAHIKKYNFRYRFPEGQPRNLKGCLQILSEWDKEQFLEYRWESLKKLYEMVSGFQNSKKFADDIDKFLSPNKLLQEALDSKEDSTEEQVDKWFKMLSETVPDRLELQLARQAQEQANPFWKLAVALVAIKQKKSERWRLAEAIVHFKTDKIIDSILKESIRYLEEDPKDIETFLYFLADEFSEMLGYNSIRESTPQKCLEKAKKRAKQNKLLKSLEKLKSVMNETI